MLGTQLNIVNKQLKLLDLKTLSGGVIGKNLMIIDNGMGQLEVKGDFTITIKVLNLCTIPTPKLKSLMNLTKNLISSLLKGPVFVYNYNYFRYNPKKKTFNQKEPSRFAIKYDFNINVDVYAVSTLSHINGNDFCIAVVDKIKGTFKDKYNRVHGVAGFVYGNGDAPAIIDYTDWSKDWVIGTHEFFHSLGLSDSESTADNGTIMYHLAAALGTKLKQEDKSTLYQYIMRDLRNMTQSTYRNPNMNTVLKLRQQLNNPANAISYNRNNFR